jgi:hypothetical protein
VGRAEVEEQLWPCHASAIHAAQPIKTAIIVTIIGT